MKKLNEITIKVLLLMALVLVPTAAFAEPCQSETQTNIKPTMTDPSTAQVPISVQKATAADPTNRIDPATVQNPQSSQQIVPITK